MKKIILTVFISFLFMASCDDSNPLNDSDRTLINDYGALIADTLYAVNDTFIVNGKASTALSPKLLLGENEEFTSRFLVKFVSLPKDTADTLELNAVYLGLSSFSTYGDDMGSVNARIHVVQTEWDEAVNLDENWDDFMGNIDPVPLKNTIFDPGESDTVSYTIDLPLNEFQEVLQAWRDTTGGGMNFGLFLDYDFAGHMREFRSSETSDFSMSPRLVYEYRDTIRDSIFQDTVYASIDASLINFEGNFDPENMIVSAGYTTRTFFEFDFSQIPENAVMASADFVFSQDTINSRLNENRSKTLLLRNIVSEYELLPEFELDSTFLINAFYNVVLTQESDNSVSIDNALKSGTAQIFIQDIVNGDAVNGSFMVLYANEGDDVSVYAIRDSEDPVRAMRPRLILEYFLVPNPRL